MTRAMGMISHTQALEVDNHNLRRNFDALGIQVSTLQSELKARNTEIMALKLTGAQALNELQAEINRLHAQFMAMQADLQERLKKGELYFLIGTR